MSVELYRKGIFQNICIFKIGKKIERGFYVVSIIVSYQIFKLFGKERLDIVLKVVLFSSPHPHPISYVRSRSGKNVSICLQSNACPACSIMMAFKTQESNHSGDTKF